MPHLFPWLQPVYSGYSHCFNGEVSQLHQMQLSANAPTICKLPHIEQRLKCRKFLLGCTASNALDEGRIKDIGRYANITPAAFVGPPKKLNKYATFGQEIGRILDEAIEPRKCRAGEI